MSLQALQDFTFISRYAQFHNQKHRRETWDEAVDRVRDMMLRRFAGKGIDDEIKWAYEMMRQKRVLGSQRALQFGGKAIEDKHLRIYNCLFSYCDRLRFFQECLYALLCGCGTGFSVQKHHIAKLPPFSNYAPKLTEKVFVIPDSIEGWADALGVLISSYFTDPVFPEYANCAVSFDYSLIRPKGSPLSSCSGKAPGPEPLRNALEKIRRVLNNSSAHADFIRPIDAYDIVMHSSDAVLSGGVRRSSTIALFSLDDDAMMQAKTGNWFIENPQRGRSNNSVVLLRNKTSFDQFKKIQQYVKEYGEPATIWVDDLESGFNPCSPGWAKILTKNGIRNLKEISIGDEIWSESGWTRVINKVSTGVKPVFCYSTSFSKFYGTNNHRIISNGAKIVVDDAASIDILRGCDHKPLAKFDPQDVMDGLVLGDGAKKYAFTKKSSSILYIGKDDYEYFDSEIGYLLGRLSTKKGKCLVHYIKTTLTDNELPKIKHRFIPDRFIQNSNKLVGLLRGLFSANGCVAPSGVSIKTTSKQLSEDIQVSLNSLGIKSRIVIAEPYVRNFPNGAYQCNRAYTIVINTDAKKFQDLIGFIHKYKNVALDIYTKSKNRIFDMVTTSPIISKEYICDDEVFDITVDNITHTYWTYGSNVSNCVEVNFFAYDENSNSGWQACNLSTINCGKVKTPEEFYECCRAAAIIGTLQAAFTNLEYFGQISESIFQREALLGVSMTGMMENHSIALSPEVQRKGAEIVKQTNKEIAPKIGIRCSARTTVAKPEGTTSCLLGTSSGIHPHHAKRYFRLVQSNTMDLAHQWFKKHNPFAVEKSVWSANDTDEVIRFCIEVPDGSKLKNQISAIEMLETVKLTYQNWITYGKDVDLCIKPWLSHNVSNTVIVKPEEWDEVTRYIYDNRQYFAGISLLPASGDKDYPQAPFTTVHLPHEIVRMYGDASLFASGIIESALQAFDNLWQAGDVFLGINDKFETNIEQETWLIKANKFTTRYFKGDKRQMIYCLKDVYNWKLWCDLNREYQTVDYTQCIEYEDNTKLEETLACAGGKCDL